MFNAFVITLRELAELLLIAQALQLCLRQNGRPQVFRSVLVGMVIGVLLGGALVAWLAHRPLEDTLSAVITVLFSLAIVLLTTSMLSTAQVIRNRVEALIDATVASPSGAMLVAGFALIVGLREAVEAGVFLQAIGESIGSAETITGAALGGVAAGCLVLVYRRVKARIKLLVLFGTSTLLMSLLSFQLLIAGLGELLRAQLHADSSWLDASEPFLEGGRLYPWVCAALMSLPSTSLARRWWRDAASPARG